MTRPEIIRADSIDLQDQNAPSAQDHSRKTPNSGPMGVGSTAPHQAEALREVAAEAAEQNHRSPRVSREWTNSDEVQKLQQFGEDDLAAAVSSKLNGSNYQQQDALAIAQNGGLTGLSTEDAEMADAEGDDDMEDDMMDKISSSPSIDDGGYSLPQLWPPRSSSLSKSPSTLSFSQACGESSSPSLETPEYFPLHPRRGQIGKEMTQGGQIQYDHHLLGEYPDYLDDSDTDSDTSLDSHQTGGAVSPSPANKAGHHVGYFHHSYEHDPFTDELPKKSLDQHNPEDHSRYALTLPYDSSDDEEDDDYEIPYNPDSRYVDSGWGGECLQDTEDIDFEFVYALHTFVATVEGQANATKGDTMVLLDDSNSYWWLVRVVKDSSIGYLPAEHIETPTERLARLNKHRNIDLTSAMLGDQAEKPKNPLKMAIRRRNAKTVAFAAPTYVEASDVDYSTDEEEDAEGEYYGQNGDGDQNADQQNATIEEDDVDRVEPLKPRAAEIKEAASASEPNAKAEEAVSDVKDDTARTSDEIFDGKLESKSRNGTVRNTDSFFKDDTVETRKITLTPNLLRDDSSTSTRTSNDSKDFKQRPSLDKVEKDSSPEKSKDKKDKKDKKEKDKKPGMLSGLFKRKEKRTKTTEEEVDELMAGKRSGENSRGSPVPSKNSEDAASIEEQALVSAPEIQRNPSKLQKQPRIEGSGRKAGLAKEPKPLESTQERAVPVESVPEPVQTPSMRLVESDPAENSMQPRALSTERTRDPALVTAAPKEPAPIITAPKEQKSVGPISKILRSGNPDPKPVKLKKAKARVELDDFDSSPDNSSVDELEQAPSQQFPQAIPGSFPDSYTSTPAQEKPNPVEERLSESPVEVSPLTPLQSYPPPLMVDNSSQEEPSPRSSVSPELIDADDAREKKGQASSTTSASTPTWSDAHLRTFFDDDADIKDLLVVVYDKSNVAPAGPDHPVVGNLFREENAKLADITNRLDGMLGDWLARKMRAQASR